MPRLLCLTLAATLVLSACGEDAATKDDATTDSDATGDGLDALATTPEQRFVAEAGREGCRIYQECTPEAAQEFYSYDDCIAAVETSLSFWQFTDCTFDAARADQCLELYRSIQDCSDGTGSPGECDEVWECP